MALLEMLKLVKSEYVNPTIMGSYNGFCHVLIFLTINKKKLNIKRTDIDRFTKYLKRVQKNQQIFYLFNGDVCGSPNLYMWKPSDRQGRIDWLDKHIKIQEEKLAQKIN